MSADSTPTNPFGANEWLVDELYQQYLEDRSTVDPAWWDFFADYQPGSYPVTRHEALQDRAVLTDAATGTQTTSRTSPAEEMLQPTDQAAGMAAAAQGAGAGDGQAVPQPAPGEPTSVPIHEPRESPSPTAPAARAPATPTPEPEAPATQPYTPVAQPPLGDRSIPTSAILTAPKVAPAPPTAKDTTEAPIKGVAARVASNMEASLGIPTATSVRSVPAKLLMDNRIVINNHLARARGGKVSFTHLIGYAVVKALKLMPAMNNSFGVVDDKPTLVTPAHVNFGLAIDLPRPDGTRQLLVPSIKGAESMEFAEFWVTYEDLIRRARTGKLKERKCSWFRMPFGLS